MIITQFKKFESTNKYSYTSHHFCSAECTPGPGKLADIGVGIFSCCTQDICNTFGSLGEKITRSETECGLSYFETDLKIVGGTTAVAHSWPSVVLVKFNYKGEFKLLTGRLVTLEFKGSCGGTLISDNIVVSFF